MRLICPNCDAQYEVADDVIPTEGRDVQCSNCGQTWYQNHLDHDADPDEADPVAEDAARPAPVEGDSAAPDTDPPQDEAPAPGPVRRELDPSVADILRQEAQLESKARAEAAQALETQPDLGLDTANIQKATPPKQTRESATTRPDAATTSKQTPDTKETSSTSGSRRDLLPDIEEINSTLRSTSDRRSGVAADPTPNTADLPQGKSGFGRGFVVMIVLAIGLGAIYNFAPMIAKSVPEVDPYLSAYVAQVDMARFWLDGQVTRLLAWLDAVASSQTGTP